MRTVQIERYIHEEASDAQIARWEKSHQKGSLPPRGPRCGVMVARVVDDQHYVIGVSLVNPGHHIKGGKLVGFDKFELKFTEQKDWFTKKTWTEAQQEEFRVWFIAQARKDLKMTKRYAESEFSWFNLMYGWNTKG